MKRLVIILALIVGAVMPMTAQADFKTGNTWMVTPKLAADNMVSTGYWFEGAETNNQPHKVVSAYCKGDLSNLYARNAKGWYHHLRCVAFLRDVSDHYAYFQFWQIGQGKSNFRITDIVLLAR